MPENFVGEVTEHTDDAWITANGARMVARAWTDPEYRTRMLADGTAAARGLGFDFPEHNRNLVVLENTPTVHNVIVCTLCSCTAYTIIGAAPDWYKDLDYRARVVRESRTVLGEMGLDLPATTEVRVWDTTADTRYMVLPMQPPASYEPYRTPNSRFESPWRTSRIAVFREMAYVWIWHICDKPPRRAWVRF